MRLILERVPRFYSYSTIVIVLLVIGAAIYALHAATRCPVIASYEVRGQSLDQSVPSGSEVSVAAPSCTSIQRGDIVVFQTASDTSAPVIKRVEAIPGDTFAVKNDGTILINGKVATIPDGTPYQLSSHGVTMLSLYAADYQGIIPAESYLLLGDVPSGALDSSRLGLISAQQITGVVQR